MNGQKREHEICLQLSVDRVNSSFNRRLARSGQALGVVETVAGIAR